MIIMAEEEPSRLTQALVEHHEGKVMLSIDDILVKYVGEFGQAQLLHFILTNLTLALSAMNILITIFAHREPQWRCKDHTDHCMAASSLCEITDPSSWDWLPTKQSSVVSEWNLVCNQAYKVGLAGSTFFLGGILGSGLLGSFSDKFLGRKGGVTVSCITFAVMGSLTALAPNYWVYLLLRTLTGVGYGGLTLSAFVLSTEVIGPSRRGSVSMYGFFFFTAGTICLSGLAYLSSSSWRQLYATVALPSVLYCLLVIPFLPESPRWYAVRGDVQSSLEVLKLFARRNGRSIPPNVTISVDGSKEAIKQPFRRSLIDVFQHSELRKRMVILTVTWFAGFIMFYGINFNVVNVDVNLFITVVVNAISETPGYVVSAVLLDRLGRRSLLFATLMFSGGSCLVGSLITFVLRRGSVALRMGQVISGALGLLGVGATYNLLYIYTVELFPTEVRNAALGLANQSGQVGAVVAPLVVGLAVFHSGIPFAVLGSIGVLAGMACLVLPETLGQPLWETIQGMTRTHVNDFIVYRINANAV